MSAADKIQSARALIEPLTGHTPGPWMQDGIAIAHPSEPNGYPLDICLMGEPLHFAGDVRPMLQNHEANALILAAAPTLRDTVAALADLADAQAQENARQARRIEALEEVLRFYANPVIYQPHPHGPAFDRRDMSYVAVAALGETP